MISSRQVLASLIAGVTLLPGAALHAKPGQAPKPVFTAVLAIVNRAGVAEDDLVGKLTARAESLEFPVRIDPGARDDDRLAVSFFPDVEPEARVQLDRLIASPILDLRAVHPRSGQLALDVRDGDRVVPGFDYAPFATIDNNNPVTQHLLLDKRPTLQARHVKRAQADPARAGVIEVHLTKAGGARLRKVTQPMEKGVDRIAVVLDGKVLSAPVVQDTISTNFIIQGVQDNDERRALVAALAEPLGVTLRIVSFRAIANGAP